MEFDLNTVVTVFVFIAGFIAAKWDRDRSAQTKSVQVDTELRERVKYVEEKVREQGDNSKSIARLEVLYQNMARDMHELRSWAMEMRMASPLQLRRQAPRPYDFDGSDWLREDQERRS